MNVINIYIYINTYILRYQSYFPEILSPVITHKWQQIYKPLDLESCFLQGAARDTFSLKQVEPFEACSINPRNPLLSIMRILVVS